MTFREGSDEFGIGCAPALATHIVSGADGPRTWPSGRAWSVRKAAGPAREQVSPVAIASIHMQVRPGECLARLCDHPGLCIVGGHVGEDIQYVGGRG